MDTLLESPSAGGVDALSHIYGIRRVVARGDRPYVRIERDRLGPAQLHHLAFTTECEIEGSPTGRYFLGHLAAGHARYQRGRERSNAYGAGDVFLAMEPDLPWHSAVAGAELEFALLNPSLFAEVADTPPGHAAQTFRFTSYQPVSSYDAGVWRRTYRFVRDQVRATPQADNPLIVSAAARLLAATALTVFPNDTVREPTIEDRRDARPETLRRAVSFIDDHAHQDISVADIAGASFVTMRALQLAFRHHLNTTPIEYLRRVRLDRAHHDLLSADPERDSVTAVAYRWGFPNPSRFAAYYRRAYGVTPSATLHQY